MGRPPGLEVAEPPQVAADVALAELATSTAARPPWPSRRAMCRPAPRRTSPSARGGDAAARVESRRRSRDQPDGRPDRRATGNTRRANLFV